MYTMQTETEKMRKVKSSFVNREDFLNAIVSVDSAMLCCCFFK